MSQCRPRNTIIELGTVLHVSVVQSEMNCEKREWRVSLLFRLSKVVKQVRRCSFN